MSINKIQLLAAKFIRKLAQDNEGQKLLKKHLGPEETYENPIFKDLVKRDIIPIIKANKWVESAFLGAGVYSKVYEVSYKGKRAVAKITNSKKDYDAMIKLHELSAGLGADSKYIAKIYDNFIVDNPDYEPYAEGSSKYKYITIAEPLIPLSDHLIRLIYNYARPESSRVSFEPIKARKDILDIIEEVNRDFKSTLDFKRLPPDVSSNLLEKLNMALKVAFETSSTIMGFKSKFNKKLDEVESTLTNLYHDKQLSFYYIIRVFRNIVNDALEDFSMPVFFIGKEYGEKLLESPEIGNFIKFLYRLNDEFGIAWGDLHQNNIMMRPSTSDLVISDPGLFRFKRQ